jgi:hypothetical protein
VKLSSNTSSSTLMFTCADQSKSPVKTFYVEEKIKVLERIIIQSDPILEELVKQSDDYYATCVNADEECLEGKILEHWFPGGEKEMDELRNKNDMKLNVRNILGIRHQDDWIFNLNIGNVMHLATMSTEELTSKLDASHELNRDAMLEKIVLLTVSSFCVATEMRFLAMKEEHERDSNAPPIAPSMIEVSAQSKKLSSMIEQKRKGSELWHTKACRTGCTFLTNDCPLVTHIINNFKKHHKVRI